MFSNGDEVYFENQFGSVKGRVVGVQVLIQDALGEVYSIPSQDVVTVATPRAEAEGETRNGTDDVDALIDDVVGAVEDFVAEARDKAVSFVSGLGRDISAFLDSIDKPDTGESDPA